MTCGFYMITYHRFTISKPVVSLIWMVKTLWPIIKILCSEYEMHFHFQPHWTSLLSSMRTIQNRWWKVTLEYIICSETFLMLRCWKPLACLVTDTYDVPIATRADRLVNTKIWSDHLQTQSAWRSNFRNKMDFPAVWTWALILLNCVSSECTS